MSKKALLSEFVGGWLVGNFSPSLHSNEEVEVCVKFFSKGDREPAHFQLTATEWTVVISGECRIGNIKLTKGEILEIPPLEVADFEAITDVALVAIKSPSLPSDKVIS